MKGVFCNYSDTSHHQGSVHKDPVEMTTNNVLQVSKWSKHLIYTCPVCGGVKNVLLNDKEIELMTEN